MEPMFAVDLTADLSEHQQPDVKGADELLAIVNAAYELSMFADRLRDFAGCYTHQENVKKLALYSKEHRHALHERLLKTLEEIDDSGKALYKLIKRVKRRKLTPPELDELLNSSKWSSY